MTRRDDAPQGGATALALVFAMFAAATAYAFATAPDAPEGERLLPMTDVPAAPAAAVPYRGADADALAGQPTAPAYWAPVVRGAGARARIRREILEDHLRSRR